MLRTLLLVIALIVIIGIALVATGVVDLSRDVNGTVTVKTNDVTIGTQPANVSVPDVSMKTRQVEVPSISVGNSQSNGQ